MSAENTWPEIKEAAKTGATKLCLNGDSVSKRLIEEEDKLHDKVRLRLPKSLFNLKALTSLEISDTTLNTISYDFAELTNLVTVALPRNKIEASCEWFNALPNLKHLDLSFNYLSVLPEYLKIEPIETLTITNNKLFCLGNLGLSECLTTLRLEHNAISELPEGLSYCKQLREINVADNIFSEFPIDQLKQLKALKIFDISENFIEEIPVELSECRQLEKLNIQGNPIKDIGLKAMVTCNAADILDYLHSSQTD